MVKPRKRSVSISVHPDLDELFIRLSQKIIEVDGEKLKFTKSKNDIYNRALEYAVEKIDEWFK